MEFVKSKASVQFDPAVVELLAEHYPRLEQMARKQIEEVEPLRTDLFIERGAAPGAGFEPAQQARNSSGQRDAASSAGSALPARKTYSIRPDPGLAAGEEEKVIRELSRMFSSSLDARAAISTMAERLQSLVPFDCFAVYLKRGDFLRTQYIDGPLSRAFTTAAIPVGEGLSGWVAQSGRAIVNGNPTVEPNLYPGGSFFTPESSALSVPLIDAHGAIFGAIALYSREPAVYSNDHLRVLEAIQAGHLASAERESHLALAGSTAR
jgi:putative methionine-R-sulfoxide reductase with GAF domain